MAQPVVLLDHPAPHVARLRINRPDKRNAIDYDVRQGFIDHLQALLADGRTRALVFGGVEGVFSAGGDVPSMVGLSEAQARERMRHIHVLCRLVAQARIPVVSAMEGVTAGAAVGLALLGDRIVIGRNARVLFPFLKLGLAPDWGQLLTLPRRVGLPAAHRLLSDGRPVLGEEALRIGLADALAEDAEVMATAVRVASELALLPAEAFGRMKDRLHHPSASLEEELAREETDQAACLLGEDFLEGFDAFRRKRTADFIERPGARK
ncbi:enoyl-CoA hydratase-related protein [Ramlibacter tataouinensis]|uniref:enoyl-CoA hydratase/isomerase family protein n=1 Tax=Ramlibacter tataouinensis TaxID=94132 RepID=UPI0022F3E1F8|nr:enoyl-CoA hydratase-related protein [Ramlibacter tataouinensis]WBY03062.1 enoyl-CoA hydratase-related protein [Ramlibacter tataouinensis]